MPYCPKCQILSEGDICPSCAGQKLRDPEPTDPVLLITADELECDRIIAVLEDHQIPHEERISGLEAFPSAYFGHQAASNKNIFVPYSALEKSWMLLNGIGILDQTDATQLPREDGYLKEMSPLKRTVWRVVSILLFIVLIGGVVILADYIFAALKGLLGL